MSNITVLNDKFVKTRKPHQCFGCNRVFPSKTNMRRFSAVVKGLPTHLYFCEECHEHSKGYTDDDWEVTYQGDIGYWKGDEYFLTVKSTH